MRTLVFVAWAGCASLASGQCIDETATVAVDPAMPSSQDSVQLRLSASASACIPVVAGWSREGQEIIVDVAVPPGPCGLAITGFDLETELGQLPADSYVARYELDGETFCGAEPLPFEVTRAAVVRPGSPAAATLLIPRFEVDLASPAGPSTFVAVGNTSDELVIAHLVLWSEWGIPTFDFDLAVAGGEVRTLDLRSVLAGDLQPISSTDPLDGCDDPAPLDASAIAALVAQHTGQPHPDSGLCYGSDRAGPQTAVGYLTIDAANVCTSRGTDPTTEGYFVAGGTGLASNRNVLWGDYFYLDDLDNSAQGLAAVPLVADAEESGETFYSRYSGSSADGRAPLASTYRARYLVGGGFDGGTDLILWLADGRSDPAPVACDERLLSVDQCQSLYVGIFDLAGQQTGEALLLPSELSTRMAVGGADLPVSASAGYLEVSNRLLLACQIIPIGIDPVQLWVTPLLTASGRFSVGLEATRRD